MTTVSCPTCQAPVAWNDTSPYRPFCSQRCRLIDLGTWADETYRIQAHDSEDFDFLSQTDESSSSSSY